MTASLTPSLVPGYLATLSVDIRGCAVLDGSGLPAAGDPGVGSRAVALLSAPAPGAAASAGPGMIVSGSLHAQRGEYFTVAVDAGPLALAGVLADDLRRVVEALGGG